MLCYVMLCYVMLCYVMLCYVKKSVVHTFWRRPGYIACRKMALVFPPNRQGLLRKELERFSFELRKVIGFAITMPHDWLKKLAPNFHPIRSKTKTNRDSLARVFPRFASATCNYYEFWLAHCNVYGFGDWLEWLLWFWFYDAQLKTALIGY